MAFDIVMVSVIYAEYRNELIMLSVVMLRVMEPSIIAFNIITLSTKHSA